MNFIGRFLLGAAICAGGLAAVAFYSAHEGRKTCCAGPTEEAVVAETVDPAPAKPFAPSSPTPSYDAIANPANASLRINDAGLDIIKESEGLRLEAYAAGGRWYIGYGHSCTDCAGATITEAQAEAFLRDDVGVAEAAVKKRILVPVNENEFSAMVSLAYNIGSGNFAKSPVVARLNEGDRQGAADAFRIHNRAGYQVIEHLTHRREKERALFLS
ncbi:MAG: lysozyme [Amphiplicatus sp.]